MRYGPVRLYRPCVGELNCVTFVGLAAVNVKWARRDGCSGQDDVMSSSTSVCSWLQTRD
ncbi:hypothetical protein SCLCIDRAFT_1216583 [Scleroderma citrinum Foug A]|uniref:Uncharacterized protein n=1 Tax=Scleroderma citrinum Foug A TaxID=1036808 RepID=A0A0C3A784_9AGAM|nr:hypothetical protein SCLCIDRAFT_1216583 [Scleroderma citrinum Foug A]